MTQNEPLNQYAHLDDCDSAVYVACVGCVDSGVLPLEGHIQAMWVALDQLTDDLDSLLFAALEDMEDTP